MNQNLLRLLEAFVVQLRKDGELGKQLAIDMEQKQSDLKYILEVGFTGLADSLDSGVKEKEAS